MSYLYTAKYVVSAGAPPVEGGAFVVQDLRIIATGTYAEMGRAYPNAETVDFGEAIIAPLLVNAHTHLELSDYPLWQKQLAAGQPPATFVDWILHLVAIKRQLNEDDYRRSLRHGIEQSLTAGTGVVGDILSRFSLAPLYAGVPLLGRVFLETLGHDQERIAQQTGEIDTLLNGDTPGALAWGISPHSPYTIGPDYLQRIYSDSRNNGIGCSTHVAESPEEVDFVARRHGAMATQFYPAVGWEHYLGTGCGLSPVAYLERQRGLFSGNLLVHGVQLNDTDIDLLAARQVPLVLCPRSNEHLNVGRAPAAKLLEAGVPLALGTDSLASCDTLSIWDEMAFAARWFDGALDAPTLFHMATLGGATVLGVESDMGTLNAGKRAAFQVLEPKCQFTAADIFDYFISPGCTADIVHVYHGGGSRIDGQQG